jgi:MoaA/NifB/PqqE/SkfB family radical SAM enzyme
MGGSPDARWRIVARAFAPVKAWGPGYTIPMQPTGAGVLQVEPTDHCNLRCRMCAPHHEGWETVHGVPKGMLSVELWERVVDGLVADDIRFDHIIFQWLGDPSLHPELSRLIGIAARKLVGRVGYLRVDTNAVRLTPDRMDALLDHLVPDGPPLLVVLTIDAHTPSTYARVKGVDALERVRRNVRHLIRARTRRQASLNLQFQFVVQEGNDHELLPFLRYWTDLLSCQGIGPWHDEVMFKRLSVGGGGPGQAAADARYEAALKRAGIAAGPHGPVHVCVWERRPWQQDDQHSPARRAPCPGLWLTPVIRHDGALLMCCADLHSELTLGNLGTASFRELWDGPQATRLRLDHIAGQFDGVCQGCGGINWYDTTPEMVAAARTRAAVLGLETA